MAKKAASRKPAAKVAAKSKAKAKPVVQAASPPPVVEMAKPSEVRRTIDGPSLQKLLRYCNNKQQSANTLTGEIREEIANAVAKKGLNKKVFSIIRQMDKMEPEVLARFIDDLYHAMDVSGLTDRADAAGVGFELPQAAAESMSANPDDDAEEAEAEVQADDGKVSRPRFGSIAPAVDPNLAAAQAALADAQAKGVA